jgi:hypothetical protein
MTGQMMTATKPRRTWAVAARGLFKADRPRAIDRHIDYFGGASWSPSADARRTGAHRDLMRATDGGMRHASLAG